MSSLRSLVQNSVDYAGLFPPAGLPLEQVAKNFASYQTALANPMLGRLVLPAGQLDALAAVAGDLVGAEVWRISALLPPWDVDSAKFAAAADLINQFNQSQNSLCVDSIETKVGSLENVAQIVGSLPARVSAFLEVGLEPDPAPKLEKIAALKAELGKPAHNVFAKIRTGSVVADQIPNIQSVASFIGTCSRIPLGFKATAGLHHPIRAEYRLTYEENPPISILHGFLNVFAASVFAFEHRIANETIEAILSEQTVANFVFDDQAMTWRDLSVPTKRILYWRKEGILSFGSCSFDEPTGELQALGYPTLFATSNS